jgi:hypothetical protein
MKLDKAPSKRARYIWQDIQLRGENNWIKN